MNEIQRLAYLDAIGVDAFVSRTQLPGAAPTRRLAVVRRSVEETPPVVPPPPGGGGAGVASLPTLDAGRGKRTVETARPARPRRAPVDVPRFSLAAIVAGDWLWLEDLGGTPLAREQVWLVRSMAHAIAMKKAGPGGSAVAPAQPRVTQFDWPIHNNQQLDLGVDAARSAVAGFLGRKLREHTCSGLVLLGDAVVDWVPPEGLPAAVARIAGTLQMLQQPSLKRGAWAELAKLAQQ